jgi:hypothetical protein
MLLKRDKYQLEKQLRSLQQEVGGPVDGSASAVEGTSSRKAAAAAVALRPATAGPRMQRVTSSTPAQQHQRPGTAGLGGHPQPSPGAASPVDPTTNAGGAPARMHPPPGLVASLQRQLRAAKAAYTQECTRRAELQTFLVDTLEQLQQQRRGQAAAARANPLIHPHADAAAPSISGACELLAKEQVVRLVIARCCPELAEGVQDLCGAARERQPGGGDAADDPTLPQSSGSSSTGGDADGLQQRVSPKLNAPGARCRPGLPVVTASVLAGFPFSPAFPSRCPLGSGSGRAQGRHAGGAAGDASSHTILQRGGGSSSRGSTPATFKLTPARPSTAGKLNILNVGEFLSERDPAVGERPGSCL